MKYLKWNEAKKVNKHPLGKETMEDLILDIQDDGFDIRLNYAVSTNEEWIDFYENSEIENVSRVGWMLELNTEKLIVHPRHHLDAQVDINGFNKYFEGVGKVHSLINRINTHFACKDFWIDTRPDNFTGILAIIEIEPTVEDALRISHSYLSSYEEELGDYDLHIGEIVGDAISFTSPLKTVEEFTTRLSEYEKDSYSMTWRNITKEGDTYLVHGLAVEEIKFKY